MIKEWSYLRKKQTKIEIFIIYVFMITQYTGFLEFDETVPDHMKCFLEKSGYLVHLLQDILREISRLTQRCYTLCVQQ